LKTFPQGTILKVEEKIQFIKKNEENEKYHVRNTKSY